VDRAACFGLRGARRSRIAFTSAGSTPSFSARKLWNATAQVQLLVTALVSRRTWIWSSEKLPP